MPAMTRRTLPTATLAVALALTACGSEQPTAPAPAPSTPATITVTGNITLRLPNFEWSTAGGCWGRGGYDDIRQGAQVVVTDNAGETVAVGKLAAGQPQKDPADASRATSCTFGFTVSAPAGRGFYGVEVSHRGRSQYAEKDLERPLELTLG